MSPSPPQRTPAERVDFRGDVAPSGHEGGNVVRSLERPDPNPSIGKEGEGKSKGGPQMPHSNRRDRGGVPTRFGSPSSEGGMDSVAKVVP